MILAVVLGVLAAIVVALVIIAVITMKSRAEKPISSEKSVSSIESVGVKTTLPGAEGGSRATHVKADLTDAGDIPPTLKSRFTVASAFAAAVFGVLGIKAFQTQIIDNKTFQSQSEENSYATVSTPAPRGYIYDRGGVKLVNNRSSLTVLADADVADDADVIARLSAVLGVPRNIVRQRINDATSGAQSQRVVASDVRLRDVAFITEHSDAFSGVTVETRTVREYPYGALASHVLGYVGTVSEDELTVIPQGRDIESGDNVGKSGIEAQYDSLLSGEHGQRKVLTDAEGNVREVVSTTAASRGSDVYLTIAAPVQYLADQLLAQLVAPGGDIGTGTGVGSSVVVMDVRNGDVIALANYPTFSPENFIGGIPTEIWDLYNTEESHYPLLNRAIAGAYPAASTYKAFTGTAALQNGFADKESEWTCTGSWDGYGSGDWQNCWLLSGHGPLDLREGIVNSCDVVFYEIAKDFFYAGKTQGGTISDTAMQEEIMKFHYGQKTGIDLDGELTGRVPTPAWKAEYFKDAPEEAQWKGGDMTNMVIGQGYVLVTPIQQCVGYAGIATGNILKPHLLKEVRNSQGDVVVSRGAEIIDQPDVKKENLEYIRDALHGVAQEQTTYANFYSKYGVDGACKTGTAEVAGKNDYGWFCTYGPYDDPHYVVACVCEESGGSGTKIGDVAIQLLAAAVEYENGELTDVGAIAASSGKTVENTSTVSNTRED